MPISELVVPTDAAYLELVGQYVAFVAGRMGFDERDLARIRLAVDEACANVIEHSAACAAMASFRVVCEEADGALVVRVQDTGPLFDLSGVREPSLEAPIEKQQVGGLGLYLMRRVMDSVELRPCSDGKELVLTKALRTRDGGHDAD